uniref:hypothetical protein n=1 Tax=Xaviernesmea oryzae TaxID=464029 RepID=UPI001AED0F96
LRPDTTRPENPSQHFSPWLPLRYGCHTLSTGPKPEIQDEIIETHLIRTKATELLAAAADLGNGSQDVGVASLADKIAEDVRKLLQAVERKRDISTVLS